MFNNLHKTEEKLEEKLWYLKMIKWCFELSTKSSCSEELKTLAINLSRDLKNKNGKRN